MESTTMRNRLDMGPLVKLRDLVRIIGALRDIEDPFASREGLRQSISLLLELAGLLGVPTEWADQVRAIIGDDRLLEVFLAVLQYVLGLAEHAVEDGSVRVWVQGRPDRAVTVDQKSLLDWLPLVVQIIGLLKLIRGDA